MVSFVRPGEPSNTLIFVTGASGYVGGRLVPALLAAGYSVRCLARDPRKLAERPWRSNPDVAVVAGDMSDQDQLAGQLQGCAVAFYLVHSMEATGGVYAERDRQLASNFAHAAVRAGVERIIYLGGLGEMGQGLSQHLRSRRDVEEQLASTGVPVTTFRAAMIIGAGSASFEILRYLVERLPVMITPAWVRTESQPVAITDVLHWLVRCVSVPGTTGKTLEIGGPDVLPYRDLMRIMAEELRLPKRLIIPLPVLTPKLSSLWISLVTPVSYRIARPLGEGLRNRVVVTNDEAQRLMPHQPLGVREAIFDALRQVEANDVETRWSAAGPIPGDPQWAGGTVFTDQRSVLIQADPHAVFAAVCRIGGGHGWYAGDILWRIRGWMDKLVGGPGLRRGRRNADQVEFGEALDFWRVVGIDRDRSLSLRAEMKLPGIAMLNFELKPEEDHGRTTLTMTARFRPKGLLGIMYWYAVLPLHHFVFGGMLRGIRTMAESMNRAEGSKNSDSSPGTAAPSYGRARLWDAAKHRRDDQRASTAMRRHYVKESTINAPAEVVFRFHESPDALRHLIPPWEKMEVAESAGSLLPGSKVVLRGRLGLLTIRWVAVHTEYDPPHLFADRQESGPFAWWYHRHRFLDDGQGGTILRDEVEYQAPLGLIGSWLGGWLIRRKLERMFAYRHETTRRLIESGEWTETVTSATRN